jgi:hypothetical protein
MFVCLSHYKRQKNLRWIRCKRKKLQNYHINEETQAQDIYNNTTTTRGTSRILQIKGLTTYSVTDNNKQLIYSNTICFSFDACLQYDVICSLIV